MRSGLISNFISTFISEYTTSFSLDINGDIWCIGRNISYENNDCIVNYNIPTQISNKLNIKSISCGSKHLISYDYNGNLYSLGCNNCGQLGLSKDTSLIINYPTKIEGIPKIYRATSGRFFSMFISINNELYSFGDNSFGQLGIGNFNNSFFPIKINDLNDIEIIECGDRFSICKTYNNDIYCWGDNTQGQIGLSISYTNKPLKNTCNFPKDIISIKCGINYILCLTIDGNVYSCGDNTYGQLGLDNTIQNSSKLIQIPFLHEIHIISCGFNHSICIDIKGNIWCFGCNSSGQLGLGDLENRYKPILNTLINNIIDISQGGNTVYIKTIDNKIYAFGNALYNQLSLKNHIHQNIPIQIFKEYDNIWRLSNEKSRQKSARK